MRPALILMLLTLGPLACSKSGTSEGGQLNDAERAAGGASNPADPSGPTEPSNQEGGQGGAPGDVPEPECSPAREDARFTHFRLSNLTGQYVVVAAPGTQMPGRIFSPQGHGFDAATACGAQCDDSPQYKFCGTSGPLTWLVGLEDEELEVQWDGRHDEYRPRPSACGSEALCFHKLETPAGWTVRFQATALGECLHGVPACLVTPQEGELCQLRGSLGQCAVLGDPETVVSVVDVEITDPHPTNGYEVVFE